MIMNNRIFFCIVRCWYVCFVCGQRKKDFYWVVLMVKRNWFVKLVLAQSCREIDDTKSHALLSKIPPQNDKRHTMNNILYSRSVIMWYIVLSRCLFHTLHIFNYIVSSLKFWKISFVINAFFTKQWFIA